MTAGAVSVWLTAKRPVEFSIVVRTAPEITNAMCVQLFAFTDHKLTGRIFQKMKFGLSDYLRQFLMRNAAKQRQIHQNLEHTCHI